MAQGSTQIHDQEEPTIDQRETTFARDNAGGDTPAEPSAEHPQDSQPVEGDAAMNLPPGSELIQRSKIQG